ncbi:MAG: DUF432 domain-containing protein [Candidatus Thermoplasmatota archaeon]|nr:DUF432 domain-containing protein [Candidatus Thermoplasmatota archaeon]
MFGKYDLNVDLKEQDIEILMEGRGKRRRYYRRVGDEEVEKFIHAEGGSLVICPVEPVNIPDATISEHLLIEFDKPLVIEPGIKNTFYAKFPVEIGIFLVDKKDVEEIDIFTKTKPKYTLYGPPESGIVCKWWKSDLYAEKPEVGRLYEGIVKVDIMNGYYEWVELKKFVLRAFDMKIFYDDHAYMRAHLKILKKTMGETTFSTRKPKNMQESIDIYLAKGIKKLEKKFVMEWRFK